MRDKRVVAVSLFVAALTIRLLLLHGPYDHLRHGSAGAFGSAALGLLSGNGLTIDYAEIIPMDSNVSNLTGDYRTLHADRPRALFTEFLPGPALLLAALWHIIPVYNFAPILYLQAILDALLIALFGLVAIQYHRSVIILTAVFMTIDLPAIRRTLMMGYDFWPQFTVLATVVGFVYILANHKTLRWYILLGTVTAVTLWFRDITTLLPVAMSCALYFVLRKEKVPGRRILARVVGYLVPFVISIVLLSVVRFETTGNFRPTRSTFWHTFMAGVGQFSNPYGIENNDESVWKFATALNPELAGSSLGVMYRLPDSPYERMLKEKAIEFVTQHPGLALRNILYRTAIMIAPVFYVDGDFAPRETTARLYPLGFILMPLWILGMIHMRRGYPLLFAVSLAVFVSFFISFSWFYIAGRAILPYIFLSAMVWLFGLIEGYSLLRKMWEPARSRSFPRP